MPRSSYKKRQHGATSHKYQLCKHCTDEEGRKARAFKEDSTRRLFERPFLPLFGSAQVAILGRGEKASNSSTVSQSVHGHVRPEVGESPPGLL